MIDKNNLPKCMQQETAYVFAYPQASEFADKQNAIFWLADEINMGKDVQSILVDLTPAERHGVLTVLKLFTKYEILVGEDYWLSIVAKNFPRPEFQKMASCFAFFESNVHAPFYNKINEYLHINTKEFYDSYVDTPVLKDRVEFINSVASNKDNLPLQIATFSIIEGAILYSSFAYLRHFQSGGKNKMKNLVAGNSFSARDEEIHSIAGAWLFRTLVSELALKPEDQLSLYNEIYKLAEVVRQHEHEIVDMIFEKGKIEGITAHQLKNFVDSRIDICLENLGMTAVYKPSSNPVGEWFYLGMSQAQLHDFFAGLGNQYHRDWSEEKFKW